MTSFLSWNLNGIRSVQRKGHLDWLSQGRYDVVCLQETRVAGPEEVPAPLLRPDGYQSFWDYSSEKKGYSGVAAYSKIKPQAVKTDFGDNLLSREGRLLELDWGELVLLNVYFPNGKSGPARLQYKLKFYDQFLAYLLKLKKAGRAVIFCGDVNTAHREIDLARPKANEKISGFLPEERTWIDKLLAAGFRDTFRLFTKEGGHYTWWDQMSRARERNVGWRIDYFFVSENLIPRVRRAFILPEVLGSDHAPVGLEIL